MSDEHSGFWINTTVQSRCEHVGTKQEPDLCPYCRISKLEDSISDTNIFIEKVSADNSVLISWLKRDNYNDDEIADELGWEIK